MNRHGRLLLTLLGLLAVWWGAAHVGDVPPSLLPDPVSVARALWDQRDLLAWSMLVTLTETVLGLVIGRRVRALAALGMMASRTVERWLMPLLMPLLLAQAVPVFAPAPLPVLWFGFGIASKVVMVVPVIFLPVTAAFSDGLRRADPGWLDLARTMDARPLAVLRHVRLPAFGSGLRIATAIAPFGAVIGEWVGASAGLGHVMLNANARIQTDVMFAALFVLALMTILLWALGSGRRDAAPPAALVAGHAADAACLKPGPDPVPASGRRGAIRPFDSVDRARPVEHGGADRRELLGLLQEGLHAVQSGILPDGRGGHVFDPDQLQPPE